MLSKELETKLNEQINAELYSAYLYLSMSAFCDASNLPGFGHWMRKQAQEEVGHAMKIFAFVNDRQGRVVLQAIPEPPKDFGSPLQLFEAVLEHERKVTGMIHTLYTQAVQEKDYPTQTFLQWFINEQVEEEKTASEIVEALRMVGDKGHALYMLDRQLAQR
ncbi:MAG: ferritin [candidate division KSB1 bacterium]|nr:ferritin [candidate division KSB1 bacterium]